MNNKHRDVYLLYYEISTHVCFFKYNFKHLLKTKYNTTLSLCLSKSLLIKPYASPTLVGQFTNQITWLLLLNKQKLGQTRLCISFNKNACLTWLADFGQEIGIAVK